MNMTTAQDVSSEIAEVRNELEGMGQAIDGLAEDFADADDGFLDELAELRAENAQALARLERFGDGSCLGFTPEEDSTVSAD